MLIQIADDDGVAENTFKDTGAVVLLLLLLLKKMRKTTVSINICKRIFFDTQ